MGSSAVFVVSGAVRSGAAFAAAGAGAAAVVFTTDFVGVAGIVVDGGFGSGAGGEGAGGIVESSTSRIRNRGGDAGRFASASPSAPCSARAATTHPVSPSLTDPSSP